MTRPMVFALALVCVIVIVQLLFPLFFSYIFSYFFSALWAGKNAALSGLTPRAELVQENQSLQQQVAFDEIAASSSKGLIDQNEELQSLLGRPSGAKGLVLGNVLRRPPGAGYDDLIVDVGSSNGVSAGSFVYSVGSTPIGQVVEAGAHSSKVELYSSPGTDYDVLIGANHTPGTATGQGGGFFSMSLSRESGVTIGDEVIIPAISSMPFSTVSAVISDPAQPFEKIEFEDSINPYQSLFMLIETSTRSQRSFVGSLLASSSTSTAASLSAASSSSIPKKSRTK